MTIWAELKTETGKLTPAQCETRVELAIGNEVYMWRPSDLDEIVAVLSGAQEVAA